MEKEDGGGGRARKRRWFFSAALARLHAERRYRVFADIERVAGRFPNAILHSLDGPRPVVIWCSNDYLGMAQHPKVIGAMVEAAARMGTGAGGTRNIAGTNHPLIELERELADLHGKPASLVFTSGYVSNETGIATIARLLPNCLILSDALNHNSMIEGVRQSGSEKQIWRHNDTAHLEKLLKAADPARPKLIVFESLYSMDGDIAPVHAICDHTWTLRISAAVLIVRFRETYSRANLQVIDDRRQPRHCCFVELFALLRRTSAAHRFQRGQAVVKEDPVQVRSVEPETSALCATEEETVLSVGELGHLGVVARAIHGFAVLR